MNLNIETTANNIKEIVATSGLKILLSIIILFIGFKFANLITNLIDKKLKNKVLINLLDHFLYQRFHGFLR